MVADATDAIQRILEDGKGADTNIWIDPEFACNRAAVRGGETSRSVTPFTGTWVYDQSLAFEYEGSVLPPPLPVEQAWGCTCAWFHGPDRAIPVADSVNGATGQMMATTTDLELPGAGKPLNFQRTYNGGDASEGPLGTGWSTGFDASLTEDTLTGDVTFRDPTGGRARYALQVGDDYLGDPGVQGTLEALGGGGWTLTGPSGDVMTFDADGYLITDEDRAGKGLTFTYTGSGPSRHVSEVTDATGRSLTFTYGTTGAADGKIVSAEMDDGRIVEYDYDTVNGTSHLVTVTDPDEAVTELSYDSVTGQLDQVTTPGEHDTAQNVYDEETGRIIEQTDANGETWHFDWRPSDGLPEGTGVQITTDPRGNKVRDIYYGYVLVKHIDANGYKTRYSYDEDLNLVAVTDARGYVTTMTYDGAGNMLTRTSPEPSAYEEIWTYNVDNTVDTYTNGDGHTTEYTYDGDGRSLTVTDPLSHTTTYTWTGLGRLDTVTTPESRVTDRDYDADGNLTSETSPGGDVTTYTYDDAGRVLTVTSPRGNELGATAEDFTTHYTYDDSGRVLTITDPADAVTTNSYDDDGSLETTTTEDDGPTSWSTAPTPTTTSAGLYGQRIRPDHEHQHLRRERQSRLDHGCHGCDHDVHVHADEPGRHHCVA